MAIPGATQALIASFAFGIVVNAASAALFLYIKGHGLTVFRDGLRLALITFLLFAALWAQVDFLTLFIDSNALAACQAVVSLSTLFDQLSRTSIEQYLVWATNNGASSSIQQLALQVVVFGRSVAGVVFVGFSRPKFEPVCVPNSSVAALAILVVALDVVIIIGSVIQAVTSGLSTPSKDNVGGSNYKKLILLVVAGFAVWTGTSATMIITTSTTVLLLKTTVPAISLFSLIVLVIAGSDALPSTQSRLSSTSTHISSPRLEGARSLSTSDSAYQPPSRYEDVKYYEGQSSFGAYTQTEAWRQDIPRTETSGRGGLPAISRPITGIAGVGGLPIQGQLFPPPCGSTAPVTNSSIPASNARSKRGHSDSRRKQANKIMISNPILLSSGNLNPLNKVATIDLATAARLEKERREGALLQRDSALIATRPAPRPPTLAPEEGVKRAISLKRKEVASFYSSGPSISSSLEPMPTNSLTTSAQLSPGVEELRRRSPRDPLQQHQPKSSWTKSVSPSRETRVAIPPTGASEEALSLPNIQDPRELEWSDIQPSQEPPREPVKTPLQRRATTGLPGHPKSRAIGVVDHDGDALRHQTVMFVNNIVYDDPGVVDSIINEVQSKGLSQFSSGSVVHRPRPIPRKPDTHRWSKSGGSFSVRVSSPLEIPSFPPTPRTAPSNVPSKSLDKDGLFWLSPDTKINRFGRRSSVPDLPPLPDVLPVDNLTAATMEHPRPSKDLGGSPSPRNDPSKAEDLPYGPEGGPLSDERSARTFADNSWLSPNDRHPTRKSQESNLKRASSPLIPTLRISAMTENSDDGSRNDDSSSCRSIHSPVSPVHVLAPPHNASSTYTQNSWQQEYDSARIDNLDIGSSENDDRYQSIPITLDESFDTERHPTQQTRTSWMLDKDEDFMVDERKSHWHHRVGDECPSFSRRPSVSNKYQNARLKKMPPPAPLILSVPSTRNPVIIKAAEPSPLETPEEALAEIQAKLKKLEDHNRDSTDSLAKERMTLLQSLEQEMNVHQGRWLDLQHNLARDSISTLKTSPTVESRHQSIGTKRQSGITERAAPRYSRSSIGSVLHSAEDESSSQDYSSSSGSVWHSGLLQFQDEYMGNTRFTLMGQDKERLSSLSQAQSAALGSPTPPESDASDDDEPTESRRIASLISSVVLPLSPTPAPKTLWAPAVHHVCLPSLPALWIAPKTDSGAHEEVELPGLFVRRTAKKGDAPLTIESHRLWQLPVLKLTPNVTGLWQPPYATTQSFIQIALEQEPQADTNSSLPATRRPPRRQKRMTLLPDILEDPEPLPNRRGTLGIFRFPWGEKSDNATVQPRAAALTAMPGTMSSGGSVLSAPIEVKARQAEWDEYSSSFLDDYEENFDEDDGGSNSGDDMFDESVLWEIADLLKSENVPSAESLLPSSAATPRKVRYISEEPSDLEDDVFVQALENSNAKEDDFPKRLTGPQLWVSSSETNTAHAFGLSMPGDEEWKRYIPDSSYGTIRARPRKSDPSSIESKSLWGIVPRPRTQPNLWVPPTKEANDGRPGLPQPEEKLWMTYCSQVAGSIRARTIKSPPAIIESNKLWEARKVVTTRRPDGEISLWVSMAMQPKVAHLWAHETPKVQIRHGLPHPVEKLWEKYCLSSISTIRSKPRRSDEEAIKSETLWQASSDQEPSEEIWATWTPSRGKPATVEPLKIEVQQPQPLLWKGVPAQEEPECQGGLFRAGSGRSNYRTTSATPAALVVSTKPRSGDRKPLDTLESTNLWSAQRTSLVL